MSFFGWKKKLAISDEDPSYKVRYLGNVQTAMMKGEGCVDKPVGIIWSNYMRSAHPGLDMRLVITGSGLQAHTKEQGLTEYRSHRISYCIAHPKYPRVFVWVYRHQGKKMKMELRCHAVLCKTEAKAKAMVLQLQEKLSFALKEFQREKLRKQNSRFILLRTNSLPRAGSVLPMRKVMLSTANNFKPASNKSNSAPKLGAISEDEEHSFEDCSFDENFLESDFGEIAEQIDENENLESASEMIEALTLHGQSSLPSGSGDSPLVIDVEIGNDIAELREDCDVQYCLNHTDSDEESAESGFHDQDPRDGGCSGGSEEKPEEDAVSVCELPVPEVHEAHEDEITSF